MRPDEMAFLRDFFRAVTDRPLEFVDGQASPYYIPLYDQPDLAQHDPVRLLERPILFTGGESVQLFSGFRGSGKSTELRRLRRRVEEQGYKVILIDIEDYLNLSQPVDVSDFLMALAEAFGVALVEEKLLGGDPAKEGYWTRFQNFLVRTHIEFPDVAEGGVKAALKSDPSFRQKLQERMTGHLGGFVADVHDYLRECVQKVKRRFGDGTEMVLLVDSMEHIRGTSTNAESVQESVENLFAMHVDKLHLPHIHVVYTVPPFVKVLYPNLGALYAPGGVQVLPTLKLRDRSGTAVFQPALDLLERLIAARGRWQRLLGENRALLDSLSLQSGGHLRDFLRLFAEIIRRADRIPVPEETVEAAVQQIRSEFLPIAVADAVWLARIVDTHDPGLPERARLHDLARFLDTHLVLCYRNGEEWYDVHPLVRGVVIGQAAQAAAHAAKERAAAQVVKDHP